MCAPSLVSGRLSAMRRKSSAVILGCLPLYWAGWQAVTLAGGNRADVGVIQIVLQPGQVTTHTEYRAMNRTTRGTLTMAIATLLAIAACTGDEYTEDGQLVEKTNVRVVGVDFGRATDSLDQLTDETDTFAPSDTIYASVQTKGSSPKTVLGVRWKDPKGDEINMNNIVIRPTGDTSTLFALHHLVALDPGPYTLNMRVNGKVVRTADFTVSKT